MMRISQEFGFTDSQNENAAITARETYSYSFCAVVRLQSMT